MVMGFVLGVVVGGGGVFAITKARGQQRQFPPNQGFPPPNQGFPPQQGPPPQAGPYPPRQQQQRPPQQW